MNEKIKKESIDLLQGWGKEPVKNIGNLTKEQLENLDGRICANFNTRIHINKPNGFHQDMWNAYASGVIDTLQALNIRPPTGWKNMVFHCSFILED